MSAESLEAVLAAVDREPRFRLLKSKLYEDQNGKAIVGAANFHLQLSAKDMGADEKLALAMMKLIASRLPRLELSPVPEGQEVVALPMIVNFNLVADGHIADILEESMTDVAEALRLWSPLRLAKNVHAVVEWANAMLLMIAFCDESSSL